MVIFLEEEEDVEHNWSSKGQDAETTEDATKRIAVCNLNWDRIKCQDIMMVLSSFKPTGSVIESVTVS